MKEFSIGKWKMSALSVAVLLVSMIALAGFRLDDVGVIAAEDSYDLPFELERDPWLGTLWYVSDKVFNISVYVISLPDVGNYRASNNSKVVEGALQACEIQEIVVPLVEYGYSFARLNVSIKAQVVSSWEAYRMLVEWGSNVIVVNAHDEYLPVPSGYTREEWVDRIADFMLNRWGTWTHLGGYPLYRVWYQNGTTQEWGEQGFKKLMSHIGKGNVTCYPPPDWDPTDPATFDLWASQNLGINWFLYGDPMNRFHYINPGYPINYENFLIEGCYVGALYSLWGPYKPGAIIRYSPNQSTFSFGIYIHLGAWKFKGVTGRDLPSDLAMGFISSASAIWADIGEATFELCYDGYLVDTALTAIRKAEKEGRTIGLDEASTLLQNATDVFNSEKYKMATAYANQAKLAAEKATAPNNLPQTIAAIAMVIASIGIGAYYKINRKNKRKASECAK